MTFITRASKYALGALAAASILVGPLAFANNEDNNKQEVHKAGTELSVQINDNGKVTVRGAKVTAISGNTISAATMFGSTTVSWNVVTDGSTKFVDKAGRNLGLGTIQVGDVLSFNGSLNGAATSLSVNATLVKDWSKNMKIFEKHTFSGTLQTAPGSTTPTAFQYLSGGSTYTVNVSSGISILGKNWLSLPIGSFVAGDNVNVYGAVQASNTSMIDASVIRNTTR